MTKDTKIAVIGGGVTGVTTAYQLLKKGFDVTLFERHRDAAMETSFGNGGQLSASNAEVWNSWANVFKGIRWIFTPDAPLLIGATPSLHKISWMTQFLGAIPDYEKNTLRTVELALAAREVLLEMAADEGVDFDLEKRGILHFYQNKQEFEAAKKVTALLAKGNLERRAVTPAEINELEPSLKGDVYAGFYTESDFTGDIHKFTTAMVEACSRHGGSMRFETEVTAVEPSDSGVQVKYRKDDAEGAEDFDKIVICSGVMSHKFSRALKDGINIYPVKGYSITVNLDAEINQEAAPWVSLLDDNAKIVTSRLGADRFRVAGTAEINGYNKDIRASRIDPLVKWCNRHFPEMSTRDVVPWAGLRPMMPNMVPRVGPGRNSRVLYNTGHGHLGWTLSAATAKMVAEMAETEVA
jgi:D-amino-acid dehydrogenase